VLRGGHARRLFAAGRCIPSTNFGFKYVTADAVVRLRLGPQCWVLFALVSMNGQTDIRDPEDALRVGTYDA
jgi:hypothetical protein